MRNSFNAHYLDVLVESGGDQLAKEIAEGDPRSFAGIVPDTWLDLVERPGEDTLRAIWSSAAIRFPRFVDYLINFVEGAAIVSSYGAPMLMMALPNWYEEDSKFEPGFCWMGTPARIDAIARFAEETGPIPPALEALWRVANFITTKTPSILCSLDSSTRAMTEAPALLSAGVLSGPPEEIYECLKIAVVNGQIISCLTRPRGQSHWDDHLVGRFRNTDMLFSGVRLNLDDVLADWPFLKWGESQ
jgi:hypothetical protein